MKQPSRFYAAGFLMALAVRVILNGRFNITRATPQTAKAKPSTFDFEPLKYIDRREFRNGGKYYGALTRVAKHLNVNASTVEMVSRGACISKRVLEAIIAEVERIDSDSKASPLPLSAAEKAQFSRGGKYYGASSRVAASLGMLNSNMHRVLRGKQRSPRVLSAIRTEMARVDAELAVKNGGAA